MDDKKDPPIRVNFLFTAEALLLFNKGTSREQIVSEINSAITDKEVGLKKLIEMIGDKTPSTAQKMLLENLNHLLDRINNGVKKWSVRDFDSSANLRLEELKNETKH